MRPNPLALLVLTLSSASVHAGMVSYQLNDVAKLRLEEISFFTVLLALCGAALKLLWNYIARDFQKMPRLSYGRALAATSILGLLMVLVLSMISGARELLTPGAWHREGVGYKLVDPASMRLRQRSMEQLRAAMFAYSTTNHGRFPNHDFVAEIPEKLWQSPDRDGTRYVYVPGLTVSATNSLLAFEPYPFGSERFALFGNGEIRLMSISQIRTMAGAMEEK